MTRSRSVLRAGRRALWRHPVQLLLAVAGVALGVAVVIGMDLANQSASTAMRQSMQAVAGRTTHQIFGGPEGLPESLYVKLRTRLGVWQAAPVVEGGFTVPSAGNRPLTLVGIDPFAGAELRGPITPQQKSGGRGVFEELLLTPASIVLPAQEARRLGVKAGDTLTVQIGGQKRRLDVVAVAGDLHHDLSGYAFTDIATAQDLLGRVGRLSRIDLILDAGEVGRVRAALPPGADLVPAAARANAMQQMSAAFQTNLTALSLLALVIGLFLVFNTMSFMVVQRRRMIGILRAVGATRRQILTQVLSDAALIGLLGTAIGVLLGLALGIGLVDLVGRGSTDASFQEAITRFQIEPLSLAKGFLLGIVGSVLAAAPPAFEAATVAPRAAMDRSDLERRVRRGAQLAAGAGGAALIAGVLILVASSGLVAAFIGLFAVILGASMLAPLASARVTAGMARFVPRRPIARLMLRGVAASLSRTGVAIAALAVAISAVIGVAVMIDSFRGSFIVWLQQSLRADFYIAAAQGDSNTVDDTLAKRIESLPGVAFITRSRHYRLPSADGFTALWALGLERRGWQRFDIREGDRDAAWKAFRSGAGVLISEPYAYKHDLSVGESLSLRTASGERVFRVAGIFRDYGSPYGVVLIYLPVYRQLFGDSRLSGLGVYLSAGADRSAVRQSLEGAVAGLAGVQVRDNQSIRQRSLEVFDQEFVITSVLRLLAALVAFIGVVGALMALQLDRTRELAVLRAIGFTRTQLGSLITAQSGLLGLAAGLFSIPLGLILAWLLVFVINHRAFGWSMEFTVSPGPLLEGVGLAIAAALIAALYPAWRAVHTLPARGLREE